MNQQQQPTVRPPHAPLPADVPSMMRQRVTQPVRTLNDHVDDLHTLLYGESEEYRNYLEAVYDEQAVEGSLSCDNTKAAEMIRDKAKAMALTNVSAQKLAPISKALNVVLRRFRMSRQQRRNMIDGEIVPDNGD